MVVLEDMLLSATNQYLHPDCLSSLPTTLDAKKSPLALLAQTCSQIGIDTEATTKPQKSPINTTKKAYGVEGNAQFSHSENYYQPKSTSKIELPVKSCEGTVFVENNINHFAKSTAENCVNEDTIISGHSFETHSGSSSINFPNSEERTSPEQTFTSCIIADANREDKSENAVIHELSNKTPFDTSASMDLPSSSQANSSCCSSWEQTKPSFRSSISRPNLNVHRNMSFSCGYSSTGFYSNYLREKNTNGEALLPMCKDSFCTGCQYSMHNQQLLLNGVSGSCPPCSQCDPQKYNFVPTTSFIPGTVPTSSTYTPLVRPYICNWFCGDTYCGKRFITSEELLQHLRTHTSGIEALSLATSSLPSLLNPLSLYTSPTLQRQGYINSVSSIASRYHPYSKTMLQTLLGSTYNAFSPSANGPYYSPYAVYNQRSGTTTVHP